MVGFVTVLPARRGRRHQPEDFGRRKILGEGVKLLVGLFGREGRACPPMIRDATRDPEWSGRIGGIVSGVPEVPKSLGGRALRARCADSRLINLVMSLPP